jgi:hypothetical protein
MMISRRALLLAGAAFPASAFAQCVTGSPSVDACLGGVRQTTPSASLDLDFMTPGALNPALTFTRASTGTYFDNTGTMQTAAANAPRWDYDTNPSVLRGLLIEEARTNVIKNSTMVGAVAGSPGTDPTGWVVNGSAFAGLTKTITTGTESGVAYVEYRLSGTATAGTIQFNMSPAGTSSSPVSASTQYCFTSYISITAGTKTNISANYQTQTNQYDNGGVYLGSLNTGNIPISGLTVGDPLTKTRAGGAFTAVSASNVNFMNMYLLFTLTAGVVDFTIRIGAPQLEAGAFASSFIPTSTVAVTRAIDNCSMPAGAWFNVSASSLAAEYSINGPLPNPTTASRDVCVLSDGTPSNRLGLRGLSGSLNTTLFYSTVAGTSVSSVPMGNVVASRTVTKTAAAWDGVTPRGSLNGAAVVGYSQGMPSGINTLVVGNVLLSSTQTLNGHIRRVRYWPLALAPADLQAVTA